MVIHKQNTSEKKDKNWFMFAMGLSHHVFSDYVSLKLNFQLETLAFAQTNLVGMVEVVEKSLKLHLAMKERLENSLSHYSSNYGHNIEKLRLKAVTYNQVFDESDIKQFTKPFDDKKGALYQHLRYGSQQNIDGFKTHLGELMPIVEKIFFSSILRLEDIDKKMVNNSSLLCNLIINNQFHQSRNRDLLLNAVQSNNPYFTEYEEYCWELENERRIMTKAIESHEANQKDAPDLTPVR